MAGRGPLTDHPQYLGIVALVLLAAFTKSAQFPFHFWLPNAMQAPTPVSAYLHSATMVKAGVYLVARMTPLLGGTTMWMGTITVVATLTMILGALRALFETDLKRVLAYSTISALGILMLLFGMGTPEAVAAGFAYLLAHACYKGALFLVAGAVEHETGTRDVASLGGLRRAMPLTAIGAALAAGSMAGIPFFGGFIAKEQFYESIGMSPLPGIWSGVLVSLAVAASMCLGAAGLIAGIAPFQGRFTPAPATHDAPPSLWLGPLVLGVLGVVLGILPALAAGPIALAGESVTGSRSTLMPGLWHGFTATLLLSALTVAGSLVLFTCARSIVAASVADRAERRAALHVHAGRARCAQPARRSRDAECVTPFVRPHRRRHGHRAGGVSRWRPGARFRRHAAGRRSSSTKLRLPRSSLPGRCRPRSHARAWPPRCRSVPSGTGLP